MKQTTLYISNDVTPPPPPPKKTKKTRCYICIAVDLYEFTYFS